MNSGLGCGKIWGKTSISNVQSKLGKLSHDVNNAVRCINKTVM